MSSPGTEAGTDTVAGTAAGADAGSAADADAGSLARSPVSGAAGGAVGGAAGVFVAPPRPMRADARRNYDRLLAVAADAFSARGAEASLEDIARQAGVGIGTLYRHFPTRGALLEASYLARMQALCDQADVLLAEPDPSAGLVTWLRAFAEHNVRSRGLKDVLAAAMQEEGSSLSACKTMLRAAVDALLSRAQQAGAIRADLTPNELMRLVHAVFLTAEVGAAGGEPDPAQTDRLLSLLLDGLRGGAAAGAP
jgi:AcrR family transcriptional regulator